ncbi:hypothetical protein E2C01_092871 [Portunus trituberculatus]|uniref:Uncharacterized protein n=1 Tax=Portunus trituberculatus TaxID=210409 RepID=A0A5B7JHK6_PORTR|nr:hypothetical protein [Portunus trituberculatus]
MRNNRVDSLEQEQLGGGLAVYWHRKSGVYGEEEHHLLYSQEVVATAPPPFNPPLSHLNNPNRHATSLTSSQLLLATNNHAFKTVRAMVHGVCVLLASSSSVSRWAVGSNALSSRYVPFSPSPSLLSSLTITITTSLTSPSAVTNDRLRIPVPAHPKRQVKGGVLAQVTLYR